MISNLLIGLSAVSIAVAPAPVLAGDATVTKAAEAKAAKAEKKICKRLEKSHSRMAERVCLTKEQWAKIEADA